MASEAPYLRAILPSLPADVAKQIRALCNAPAASSAEHALDTLVRFVAGAECAPDATAEARAGWGEKQQEAAQILGGMAGVRRPGESKRGREDDADANAASQASKRQRSSVLDDAADDDEIFTLHAVSATSPIRKKVDITICKNSIKFTHPTTHAVEATVPRAALTRAFLLPTRGKSKPHWTIVLLSTDTTERSKPNTTATATATSQQVIFGVDATSPGPFTTTTHTTPTPQPTTAPKGSPTLPALRSFLATLSLQLHEPHPSVFKSACTGPGTGASALEGGVPGIEAYRSAKAGTLWFMPAGLLWGESKPCEFWAVEDLIGKADGVRVVNASGRTCSIILTRKSGDAGAGGGKGVNGEGEGEGEDMGVETEFSHVDAREKAGIDEWVRAYRHLFGKMPAPGAGVGGVVPQPEDSDEDDEDFEMDSDEVGDSSSSSSSEEGSEDGESDAEGSGSEGEDGDGEEEELKEENHPLMKPGAMPRMSKAAIEMVVGMMEDDMMGPESGDDLEEDQLDD